MEYNIDAFLKRLFELLKDNVPYESKENYDKKHLKRGGRRLQDLFDLNKNTTTINIDTRIVDVGGPMAEAITPQYHILQQAEVIHRKNRGTKKSLGSQANEPNLLMRDYEKVSFNGKTFTKEYTKNVRGMRSKARKILEPKLIYTNGQYKGQYKEARNTANYYVNVHYKYIDKILDVIVPFIAHEFDLKPMRKQETSLEEEYKLQVHEETEEVYNILNSLDSFME